MSHRHQAMGRSLCEGTRARMQAHCESRRYEPGLHRPGESPGDVMAGTGWAREASAHVYQAGPLLSSFTNQKESGNTGK
jgi:hypothetical protein